MTVEYNPEQRIPHPAQWHVLCRSSTPFWDGVKEGKLLLQKCKSCGSFLSPPRPMCPNCQSIDQEWTSVIAGTLFYRLLQHAVALVAVSYQDITKGVRGTKVTKHNM
ncbi:MAG: hypothetical protein HOC20_12570 [Chloroflexi bacterium]|jgi:hypothetical protein|nr:hypothetical protein [Chloroflexota bacterium]